MGLKLGSMWDFGNPEISEERFRSALEGASPDEAVILETQIARTYGLRGRFEKALEILRGLDARLPGANAEARVRAALETGRCHCSATHPPESQTPEARDNARTAYLTAAELAANEGLDGLAIDALHMLAFVDTAPADQLKWGRAALEISEKSSQASAKNWEASLRNNIGFALHDLGRHEEELEEFKRAAAIREQGQDEEAKRIARWTIAYALRALNRNDEALEEQLRLERDCDAANAPDKYVYEELEVLYRAGGDEALAKEYARKREGL
jgi:tetratricopeptide (TPR) repeat protein